MLIIIIVIILSIMIMITIYTYIKHNNSNNNSLGLHPLGREALVPRLRNDICVANYYVHI